MNRNIYRLVFNTASGMLVPVAETARSHGKAASGTALVLAGLLLASAASAEMPVACGGGSCGTAPASVTGFVTSGQANYQVSGTQGIVSQMGDKSILNWKSFNVSPGHDVRFQQVDSLASQNLVQGAIFTSLNRIWDMNPSVIAGSISQAAGQKANIILVNTNGIAFMGGSQVNLNQFTASSLDIKDSFILASLFPGDRIPQFQGETGFIKVFEGARITAGSFGRVMLIAPTVVNKGTVEAPDGQVIMAAASKVYLRASGTEDANVRGLLVEVDSPAGLDNFDTDNTGVKDGVLDGQAVALKDAALDKIGHATNLGELSTPRGNVTMVGYAVNQQGIARATTSVVANGSIYLLAKDRASSNGVFDSVGARRGGRVTLGESSLTEVLPEAGDSMGAVDGNAGAGMEKVSQVQVLGQDIRMAGGAVIDVPSGEVNLIAVDAPGSLTSADSIYTGNSPVSSAARIHIADGARISVAGLENIEVSAARNSVEVELRGDELKDSPVNRDGPLRGETAYVDINRALANANAGKSTLIAQDSLEAYQARTERTVAERSTAGGTVNVHSQGEAIIESGAVIDLSGGSLLYTPATVKTTLLTSNGKLTDLSDASAETKYDGIATRYVVDYGKWNVKEVIDLGQSFRYDPGYVEGKNAGALSVFGMKATFMQADIKGSTKVGELQRNAGVQPTGARLTLGFNDADGRNAVTNLSVPTRDYKLNQDVELTNAAALLPAGFKFGDTLSDDLKNTLRVNAGVLGKDKIALLEVFSNQAVAVRDALRTPQGGGVSIIGSGVTVNADIEATSGAISLAARNTARTVPETLTGNLPDPRLDIADGVTLSARGAWVNDLPAASAGNGMVAQVNGGKITLSAETQAGVNELIARGVVALGQGTLLDANGGGWVKADGKVVGGNGGEVSVSGFEVSGVDQNVQAYGLGKGGKITLASNRIKIGGTPENEPGALHLDPGFFERGGFADFNLTALENFTVADGTVIKPTVKSLELQPGYTLAPTGSKIESFTSIVKQDDRLRQAANLTLAAKQKDTGTGEILIGQGARIDADPKAKITLESLNVVDIQGSVTTPGGSITVLHGGGFADVNVIWLGSDALLDVSGKALTYTDSRGLTQGKVMAGGAVSLNAKTGYVVTEAGSRIDVSGAAPVRLDVLNESGGLGRMVGSDAGTLTVYAEQGVLLDGGIAAHGGSASNRGGSFDLTLSKYVELDFGSLPDITLSLAQTVAPQATGLTPEMPIPISDVVKVGVDTLEAAGFDRIAFASRDAIRLEDGLNLGANRALPLREVKLDAARIQTAGGDAALAAETLRIGNYDPSRVGGTSAVTNTGTLTLNARQLELAGKLRLEGMARAELNGTEGIQLVGVTTGIARPSGELQAVADLVFHGAVVAPTTYTQYNILAPGKNVSFTRNTNVPVQPLSALGSLKVEAKNIVQDGNLWAPFGQIEFKADESLTFKNGSLTSVAAAPGSLTPFGKMMNGRSWVYDLDSGNVPAGQLEQSELAEKSIRMSGKSVDMQAGAKLDLTGGGDLQAYEFTVGPGGSRDILADANTYAILPGYAGGIAPGDVQEAQGFNRAAGDAVYLSGVAGLADGVYTLLPAHYALLPGAYAVKLNTGIKDVLPGQAYSRQDGVRVAAGYLTDSRTNAPKDANWSGIEVLTGDQVRERSELTVTLASNFFAEGKSRPQDAGLLSVATTGTGSDSLKLDATYRLDAGSDGRGAAVDISALKLAIISGNPSGIDPAATRIDVDKLNALGAESLLLGGTRNTNGDTTMLTVGADTVTLANDAAHALKGGEIILAAKDTLTLKSGSAIEAQGAAGDAGNYIAAGNGALVRAASSTASFARDGSQDGTLGTLTGEVGSTIKASSSIALDATRQTDFQGTTIFADGKGNPVAGNLAMGATRVSFGDAPTDSEGLVFSQTELDGLNSLASLALTSYNTFDLYGDVSVGGIDAQGKPTLQNLTLRGAGLAGLGNSGKTANLRATELLIDNPANATYVAGGALGDGTLAIQADRLVLGEGDKAIKGYSTVNVTANELIGRGTGETTIAAETNLNVARISGEQGSNQALDASGKLNAAKTTADRVLAAVNALGAKWALSGTQVLFDTQATLPSGQFKLTATTGNLELGANAGVDVAGRTVGFFDVSRPASAGKAELISDNGDVVLQAGAVVNVSAAAGGDAGDVIIRATRGTAIVAGNTLQGSSPVDADGVRGEGSRFDLDVKTLADFSALNTTLNQGEFDGARSVRVRTGDVSVAAADTLKAKEVRIAVDSGKLDVAGHIDASGKDAGSIGLYAKNDVTVLAGAKLDAYATGEHENGGEVEIGAVAGRLNLAAGSSIDVHAGNGGEVLLRASRTGGGAGTEVAVDGVNSDISGAKSVVVEAVKLYEGKTTLTDTGASSGTTLSLATVNTDNTSFATNVATIKSRLGKTDDANFHVRTGVEVRSTGDMTLSKDWNLGDTAPGTPVTPNRPGGEPGVLTLRAQGNLKLNNNLSDGFNVATPFSSGTTPATLLAGDSWSYRLIAGADKDAADPLAVKVGNSDVTLAAGKLVRTGTGDIRIASGRNIVLADNKSAIYTAGRVADTVSAFVTPASVLKPVFAQGGGDVSLTALGDITGKPSAQLYSEWLYRQGAIDPATGDYTQQPAWWVRFDQFQQGVGALGGGNVTLHADGNVKDVSASTPTQGRMAATTQDSSKLVVTGGGDLRVESGGDVLGGQYYADRGDLIIKAGGKIGRSDQKITPTSQPLDTLLSLGDAQAQVQAFGDVTISNVLNPHLLVQSAGNLVVGIGATKPLRSLFSTYSADSGVDMQSLTGQVTLTEGVSSLTSTFGTLLNSAEGKRDNQLDLAYLLPPNLSATAFQGSISVGTQTRNLTMSPATDANLSLLAADSVKLNTTLSMSDRDPALIPSPVRPVSVDTVTGVLQIPKLIVNPDSPQPLDHAAVPVHLGGTAPASVYAVKGDVEGFYDKSSEHLVSTLNLPKAVRVRAGRDVRDLGVLVQHADAADVSRIEAGQDVFFSGVDRRDKAKIWVGGPGRLEVSAGRNIDLGTSAGIVSRGNLDNPNLPSSGADLQLAAGVGANGIDYQGAVNRLIAKLESGAPDDATLWQARWLVGNASLPADAALAAVKEVHALDANAQHERVRDMLFTALRSTGRDSNDVNSPFAGDFTRGYAALETLFPGIDEKNSDGSFKNYSGNIDLFASRVKTERGGNIEFLLPGGELVVGLSNTPAALVDVGSNVLGIVAAGEGDIKGFARGDILVNQSRILTVGGGDVLLWSSEGDIDAGKGKKTASAVPPPITVVDDKGNVSQILQGAVTGSGIGALSTGGIAAGDVDLVAPKGTVNAGDAGIRAGNLNIAAQIILGADNITVSGSSSGTPVADTSAATATTSGATAAGGDQTTAALAQNLADATTKNSFRPTFITAEVVGHGE